MKAILFAIFLLLASVAFLPTSTARSRELVMVGTYAVTSPTSDPNKPAVKCPPNQPYQRCIGTPPPPRN